MRFSVQCCLALLAFVIVPFGAVHGMIIEAGVLNEIDDLANPSHGLRFFDLSVSVGDNETTALADATALFADARFATPSEWDDLFAASTLTLDGGLSASDGFTTGAAGIVSSGGNYDTSLREILGITDTIDSAFIWTVPDGNTAAGSSRDLTQLNDSAFLLFQASTLPPNAEAGWLLVRPADPPVVAIPEPGTTTLMGLGALSLCVCQIRRKRKQASA